MNNKTKKEITIEMIDKIKENMDNNYQHLEYIRDIICSDNVELNGERFCWNCEYFSSPYGCSNIFGFVTPFHWCSDWKKAEKEQIENNKNIVGVCCKYNAQERLQNTFKELEQFKVEMNERLSEIEERNDRFFI